MVLDMDDDKWIFYIRQQVQQHKSLHSFDRASIFMTSSPLRGLKLEAFIPQVVAIGPFHCDVGPHHSDFTNTAETERFKTVAGKEMHKYKILIAKETAKRFMSKDFNTLITEFERFTFRVREEYDREIDWISDKKLALLLALDASFVVAVLRVCLIASKASYASRFPHPLRKSILQDFMLMENQIPLFLLMEVLRMEEDCRSDEDAEKKLGKMISKVASEFLPFSSLNEATFSSLVANLRKRTHLLDCLYYLVTFRRGSAAAKKDTITERPTTAPRAVDLANAGVKFQGTSGNVMDVSFDPWGAILTLPRIRVGDDTEKLFRNLIAYESHLVDNVEVLSYLRFMNNLVDTPEDVELLVEKGIMAQDIGSNEEVADMLNNLCVNTMCVWSGDYEDISVALNRHRNYKINILKAEFKAEFLSRPWFVLSFASAAFFLVMNIVITYFTILIYRIKNP